MFFVIIFVFAILMNSSTHCLKHMFIYMHSTAQSSSYSGDVTSDAITPIICEDGGTQKAVKADLPLNVSSERTIESTNPPLDTQTEESMTTSNPPTTSTEHQPPSSPLMDLESDFPSGETFNLSRKTTSDAQHAKNVTCGLRINTMKKHTQQQRYTHTHTHTYSQIFCVLCLSFCRTFGSEAICSTARSEETQRQLL